MLYCYFSVSWKFDTTEFGILHDFYLVFMPMFLEGKSDVYSYHVLETYSVLQTYTADCVKLIHLMKAKLRHDHSQAVLLSVLN